MALILAFEVVSVGVFGQKSIGAQSFLMLSFAVAWAMEKEK
jgi:hypothetical protein